MLLLGPISSTPASQAPASQAPASQAPASQAPASKAPSSQASQGGSGSAPSTKNDELALSGRAAGMQFTPLSGADKEKAGQMGDVYKNLKVSPAECQRVFTIAAENSKDTSAGASVAQDGASAYATGVGRAVVDTKQAKALYNKCSTMTVEVGQGISMKASTKVADGQAPGASDVIKVTTSVDAGGQKQTTYMMAGTVRGLNVSAMGMGQSPAEAKVEEVFKAQVDKVAKAK